MCNCEVVGLVECVVGVAWVVVGVVVKRVVAGVCVVFGFVVVKCVVGGALVLLL